MSESFFLGRHQYFVLQQPVSALSVRPEAGNYGFFIRTQPRVLYSATFTPLYIGITTNFAERLPSHERWAEAARLGANVIAAHVNLDEVARINEEKELIAQFRPPLNVQHQRLANMFFGR